jgi:hypothetical protein
MRVVLCLDSLIAYDPAGCGVFGRDEGGSEFSFTQQHVDILLGRWSQIVRAVGWNATSKPTADTLMVVELCISDRNKPMLLANQSFIPYLVDALLLVSTPPVYCVSFCNLTLT